MGMSYTCERIYCTASWFDYLSLTSFSMFITYLQACILVTITLSPINLPMKTVQVRTKSTLTKPRRVQLVMLNGGMNMSPFGQRQTRLDSIFQPFCGVVAMWNTMIHTQLHRPFVKTFTGKIGQKLCSTIWKQHKFTFKVVTPMQPLWVEGKLSKVEKFKCALYGFFSGSSEIKYKKSTYVV